MNSLKTLLVIALLAAGMGGVYMGLHNRGFDNRGPAEVGELDPWALAPNVQLDADLGTPYYTTGAATTAADPGSLAPPFSPPGPRDALTAPLYAGLRPGATDAQQSPVEEPSGPVDQGELYTPPSRFDTPVDPPAPDFQDPRNAPLVADPLDAVFDPLAGGPSTLCIEFLDLMQGWREKLALGRFAEVHNELSRMYDNPRLTPEERSHVTELLDEVAWTVIYSPQSLLENPYQIQPGDTLETIGKQYEVSGTLLGRINGIHPSEDLVVGREIKVVRGPFNAVVHLDSFELTLTLQGKYYAGRFPIGVGDDSSELEGSYRVTEKSVNPKYYDPNRNVIPGGDPSNPLGKYLIRLGDQVGLHGTDDPRNVGATSGRGSLCLDDRNIEDLFGILTADSRVVIRR